MNSQPINYKLTQLDLKAKLNEQYPFQFSSIVIKNDSIILVAEKCNRIYILNKKTLDVISVINDLVFPEAKVSIEGVVLYKDRYLFLLDEDNTTIYSYDLKDPKSNIKRIINDKSLKGNKYKLEGIAINEKKSICYVLHEDESKIYLFDIGKDNQLTKRKGVNPISLPKGNITWTRNTDLFYENNQLYVLSTTYGDGKPDKLKYGISLFSIIGDSTLTYQNTIELIFPESFNYYKSGGYNTNLEGFAKNGKSFYIISDNEMSNMDNCDITIEGENPLTLLLKLKLERQVKFKRR